MKTVIFDMDGVIIDSEPLHFEVDLYVLRHYGIQLTERDLDFFVGTTNPEMWASLINKYDINATVEELIDFQLNEKMKLLMSRDYQPIDGIMELLTRLKDLHFRVGLASSSPLRFIEGVLDKFDIKDYFEHVVSAEEVQYGKPAPDVFLQIAERMKVSPDQCVVIEDSRNGVRAAVSAGMKCIGFQNANSGEQNLAEVDLIVDSICSNEILHFI